jgi:hypothetical protein
LFGGPYRNSDQQFFYSPKIEGHFKGWNFCRKFLINCTAIKNSTPSAKKNRLENREIRKNRINLLLFTFENRRKVKEKSALFGGPYRNSDRQFFYSPLAVRKHAKTRKIADNRRKHHLSNKLATGASPRFRHYGV